jgi:hypothetical protein
MGVRLVKPNFQTERRTTRIKDFPVFPGVFFYFPGMSQGMSVDWNRLWTVVKNSLMGSWE